MQPKAEYDVVVAGSGVGGLGAALAAAESGLSVAVLEKDRLVGGGTALSAGGLWAGCNHLQRAAGLADSRQAVLDYLNFVGGGSSEPAHVEAFVDYAPVALEHFERCGVKTQLVLGFPDHYYPVAPGSVERGRTLEAQPISVHEVGEWGAKVRDSHIDPHRVGVGEFLASGGLVNKKGRDPALLAEREAKGIRTCGAALIVHLLKANLARSTAVFTSLGIDRLIGRDGKVDAVRTADGREIRARRGVVLATGGWEGDPTVARTFEGLPGMRSAFPKAVSGDAWRLAADHGAATAIIRNNLALILGFMVPPKSADQEPEFRHSQVRECACPHNIIVNADGERFSDEGYFPDTSAALREYDVWRRRFRNLPAYLVFDSQYVENFAFAGGAAGAPPPVWVTRADTLAELARKLGISAEGLESTARRFNGFVREGVDRDFNRGGKKWKQAKPEAIRTGSPANRALGTIEEAPFYGIEVVPAPVVPSGGLRTNAQAQVMSVRGAPIAGLYAAGNAAAHLEFGMGYQAGISLMSALTFGYLSVQHMKRGEAS
jgi:succinate dehydrogenase/fumarate reductase flavoprotein subunit